MSDSPRLTGPSSHFYVSQRMRLHYVDWGSPDKPTLLLVHGGQDHARSWDWVAQALASDYHVVAPDLRGHGDSAWALGGTYAVADYAFDLVQLVEALGGEPVRIVGHSLGGAVSLLFAGVMPERVVQLVAIEGLGPSTEMLEQLRTTPGWQRVRGWMESMQGFARREPRSYPSIDAAAARMREENGFLSEAQAHHLTVHGVARDENGSYRWKFDNYVRAISPTRLAEHEVEELRARIECPVLLMRGTESWAKDPSLDGRMRPFRNARLVNVEGAGHWLHHDELAVFLRAVREFLAETPA